MARRRARPATCGSASPGSTSCATPHGELLVLEDNLMTPSGFAYAIAARAARAGGARARRRRRARSTTCRMLGATLRSAAPTAPSPRRRAHRRAGQQRGLGARVGGARARRPAGRAARPRAARRPAAARGAPVDVVYRRTNEDRRGHGRRRAARARRARGDARGRQRVRHRRRRRQGRPRLRRGDGRVLPRRGAAAALGRDARPRATRGARARAGRARGRCGQAPSGHGGIGVVVCPHAEPEDVERPARACGRIRAIRRPAAGLALRAPDGDRRRAPARATSTCDPSYSCARTAARA